MIFVIFGIFDPFKKSQKWKLDQFLKYIPRNNPYGVRKSKKVGNIALDNQIDRPKNVEKKRNFTDFSDFWHFWPLQKRPKDEN